MEYISAIRLQLFYHALNAAQNQSRITQAQACESYADSQNIAINGSSVLIPVERQFKAAKNMSAKPNVMQGFGLSVKVMMD